MIPPRLGLAGQMGAGKTAVATRLMIEHGYVRLGFAQELRRMLEPAYGRLEKYDTVRVNGAQVTGRELLQSAGTALRSVDDRVLIRAMARRLEELPRRIRVVVDDVRTEDESDWLRLMGFTVVHLTASPAVRRLRCGSTWTEADHWTEDVNLPGVRQVGTDHLEPSAVVRILEDLEEGTWPE